MKGINATRWKMLVNLMYWESTYELKSELVNNLRCPPFCHCSGTKATHCTMNTEHMYGGGPRPDDWIPNSATKMGHSVTREDSIEITSWINKWYCDLPNRKLPRGPCNGDSACWDSFRDLLWNRRPTIRQIKYQLKCLKAQRYPALAEAPRDVNLHSSQTDQAKVLEARVGNVERIGEVAVAALEGDPVCHFAPGALWSAAAIKRTRRGLVRYATAHAQILTTLLAQSRSMKAYSVQAKEIEFEARRINVMEADAAVCAVVPSNSADLAESPRPWPLIRAVADSFWCTLRLQTNQYLRVAPFSLILQLQLHVHRLWCLMMASGKSLVDDLPLDPDPDSRSNNSDRNMWWRLYHKSESLDSDSLTPRATGLYYISGFLMLKLRLQQQKNKSSKFFGGT